MAPAPSAPIHSTAAVPEPAPIPAREAPVKPAIAANDAINSLADVAPAPAPADAAAAPPAAAAASGHVRLVSPAGSDGGGGAAAAPRTVAPAIPASPPATASALAGTAADSAVGDATDDAAGDTSADSAAAAAAAASPAFPSPPAEPTIPPGLHQLEGAFRAQFPDLNVAVHAYNPNRQQSFVIIDNHTYHEGEALPQGPVIDQIVPEGIVFDWKGRKVLYALNH
jgi:hypothetical protein